MNPSSSKIVASIRSAYPEESVPKRRRLDHYYCEAGVGFDSSGFAPRVILCGKPANLYGWAALCDEHKTVLDKYKKKHELTTPGEIENEQPSA